MQNVILTLDHEKEFWPLYRREFETAGYLVYTSATIADALSSLHRRWIDAVIMEIVFPQGPRLNYLKHIAETGGYSKLVIFSGFPEYKLDFKTWVADAFLPKTCGLPSLVGTIDYLLETTDGRYSN